MCLFMERVREMSPTGQILLVTDNFSWHRAEETLLCAEMLDMQSVF